ncbi:osmoprotectant transport system ATP-binding protein [Clostridium acetobutylicum]|uniref:ABC-type quaternary amine transporter n=1 Tax=Clostridium acetobutylicum (strain ATCC 824 / DSM 792 / JCM 1419 / IAM 19013 / LMG 5710 / NBRC 13948 / NRRL B-527 / VKM B-1787 / 2291 / W) TaxID=272562 RepID=Q97J11_CLOAB|nr:MULTISPECIES: ABC transporter ATP-binding protein [Clostridium]AAK79443.1 Proline/glycine betaine ABC transport system, ATPase component [Clostridium acetobutylicum ATCC 824]ADZ20528.1 Proline/glycine betaine ABC transport system, ATPase component [Clostridium acetobutylicum EA 2018]AEI33554.1 proline/glycine betaine ABC transport system, ATPase component [Clostridium acetobutylicum DSM 1731]AWV81311.1 ABC transporter ATP-binding protein [Clostridium acetobutylicum]MBC2392944.1 ABC transpor
MKAIEFINVSKKFSNAKYKAVDNVDLTIEEGEFITILGSSGSGKTTLLKMINRLYEPDKGSIVLFNEDIKKIDVVKLRRSIGYVIQQVGLFPHMTIANNIATVPKLLKWDKREIEKRIDELLHLVGLEPNEFKKRYPSQLSGGQQQRIGLARALAVDPKIMLLDEPFGAIDAINRMKLQDELLHIHGGLKKTFIFVTHDINEAFKLGSRVIIMDKGRICQFDTPRNIVKNPADEFVSSLISSSRNQERLWEELG